MSVPAVHWHEGMFLRPHHFQASDRHWADQVRANSRLDVHHNWGLRAVEIDPAALKNYQFQVHRLEARLRDGTVVTADRERDRLPVLPLADAFKRLPANGLLDVLLAVPVVQLGQENALAGAAAADPDRRVRYQVDAPQEPVADENTGQNPRPVQYRRLVPRLAARPYPRGGEADGFEFLTVARLQRSADAAAPPQLYPWYIPPVLACDAWPGLGEGVVGQVYNELGTRVQRLARRVADQKISLDSSAPEDRRIVERLRALNEGYAAFGVVARAGGVHPLAAYTELCRVVGKLAVFGPGLVLADDALPAYDHDDLGGCFFAARRLFDGLLADGSGQDIKVRDFVGVDNRLRVAIEPDWLAPAAQVLVGVVSPLTAAELVPLLDPNSSTARPGAGLNMKIGAFERVDEIFIRGLAGLEFQHVPNPPRVLPPTSQVCYFRVNRQASLEEWQRVADSYTMALRLNVPVGTIDGRTDVTIQAGGRAATLQFRLYVVPPGS